MHAWQVIKCVPFKHKERKELVQIGISLMAFHLNFFQPFIFVMEISERLGREDDWFNGVEPLTTTHPNLVSPLLSLPPGGHCRYCTSVVEKIYHKERASKLAGRG